MEDIEKILKNQEKAMSKVLGVGSFSKKLKTSKSQRKPINKNLRDNVWLKYIGNKPEAKCYCCKIRPIHITHFDVGHNKAVSKGGYNNIENLRPICSPCNKGMGTKSIEWYRKKYYTKPSDKPKVIKKKPVSKKLRPTPNPESNNPIFPSFQEPKIDFKF